jgi:hypothetical protein
MANDNTEIDAGIFKELGELSPGAVISEQGLAKIFSRHKVSIKRAVERGELPPSVRLLGEPVWTIKSLQDHLNKRMEAAQKEADRMKEKINKLSV